MSETEVVQENTIPLLEIKNMTKTFGPVVALNDVDLTVQKGDVLGLIGENGSGKSTITSIAAGMQKATKVESMRYKGKDWAPSSMLDALDNCGEGAHGIGMIVQESGTIAGITVAENIFLGELDQFRVFKFGPISRRKLNKAANEALEAIGITNVRGNMPMAALDFQSRKLVEIAKIMLKDPDVIVVDETSTALAHDGRQILYNIINKYRGTEKAVIFISHDLDEIMEVCDTLTVLRDGKIIRSFKKDEFDADAIRTSMIGRELQGDYYRSDFTPSWQEEVVLECKNLVLGDSLKDISVQLHKGEILGVGGLSHCGMHTLGKVLFGAVKPQKGEVLVNGTPVKNEAFAMKKNIGYVSKDRDTESLALTASIKDNIAIGGMEKYAIKNFLIWDPSEKKYVDEQINNLSIKCSDRNQTTGTLSGGNKQKVVFGKWVGRGSEILILDCPTRGVDIGVKQAMYQLMLKLKEEGKAILMISEEMPELIGMSDRILIMKDGEIKKEFIRSAELTDAEIINYMI
ncbi:MAG: sugar ABC transporter ATP-binding protein [Clostridia bacterium]|nr:sugar ABC transporter ATP-binding protein [Clostridia bacterium]